MFSILLFVIAFFKFKCKMLITPHCQLACKVNYTTPIVSLSLFYFHFVGRVKREFWGFLWNHFRQFGVQGSPWKIKRNVLQNFCVLKYFGIFKLKLNFVNLLFSFKNYFWIKSWVILYYCYFLMLHLQ